MSNKKVVLGTTLTSIANAIRSKLGVTTTYKPSEMADAIASITTGVDVSDTTATQFDVKSGKSFYDASGTKVPGNMRNISSSDFSAGWSQAKYTVSCDYSGYLNGYSIYTTLDTVPNPDVLWMMPYEILPQYTRAYFPYGGIYASNSDFEDKTPLPTPQSVSTNKVYYFDRNGYVIDAYSDVTPSASGVEVSSGMNNIESDGYLYSERPSSGTDVSDTTAIESDVISGKVFHKADGSSASGSLYIRSITPTYTPSSLNKDNYYKMNEGGFVIDNYCNSSVSPRITGTQFSGGWNYMNSSGYAYSEKPSSGATNTISVSSYTSNATITINTGLSTINFFTFLYYEDASTGRVSYCVFSKDFNESYCVSAYRSSGGSASGYIAISSSRQAYMYTVNSVSGGTIVINVPTNANYKQSSIGHAKWIAV